MRRSRPAPVGIGGRPFAFSFVPLALDSGCWFSRGAAGPATGSIPALANVAQSLDKHSYHALVEAWLFAGDRLANESYGREDFPGRDVLARVSALYRSGEERVEGRFEPVKETLRQVIVGGVAGVERPPQSPGTRVRNYFPLQGEQILP